METENIEVLLRQVQEGTVNIERAKEMLVKFLDISFAKLDHFRQKRTGFHEVVYGEGKSEEQLISIISNLKQKINRVLATRIDEKKAVAVMNAIPGLKYNPVSRTLCWIHKDESVVLYNGYIAIVCAGTSDLAVAEEAAVTAELFGAEVKRIYDVGVAGIHRLFHYLEDIRKATVIVAVAGMEGALPSVVGGLVSNPIVAVPTSIGYGANFDGLSALLSMLNSCAPGISVMNIDNGFGAGYYATLIHKNHYKNAMI